MRMRSLPGGGFVTSGMPCVDGIPIPVNFERFIPPDLDAACDFYPTYRAQGGPQKIQTYLCDIVKQFAAHESANGRDGGEHVKNDTLKAFFRHIGLPRFFEIVKENDCL